MYEFASRHCRYCGYMMPYYELDDKSCTGVCKCGNIDYCDGETQADVRDRLYSVLVEPPRIKKCRV